MSILQLRYNGATLPRGYKFADKGNILPPWWDANTGTGASKTRTKSNWYSDGTNTSFSDIMVNNHQSDLHTFFQYGQNKPSYATAKFFSWRYEIKNEKVAPNGTVTATIIVHIDPAYSRHSNPTGAGFSVVESLKVGGTQVFAFTGHTIDEFDKTSNPLTVTKQVTIPAQTELAGLDVVFSVHYSNASEHPPADVHLTLGTRLYNPSVSLYTPMMLKGDDGKWKILNDINKAIRLKKDDGTWATVPQEPLADQDKVKPNANHVYKTAEGWRQMPLPEGNTD